MPLSAISYFFFLWLTAFWQPWWRWHHLRPGELYVPHLSYVLPILLCGHVRSTCRLAPVKAIEPLMMYLFLVRNLTIEYWSFTLIVTVECDIQSLLLCLAYLELYCYSTSPLPWFLDFPMSICLVFMLLSSFYAFILYELLVCAYTLGNKYILFLCDLYICFCWCIYRNQQYILLTELLFSFSGYYVTGMNLARLSDQRRMTQFSNTSSLACSTTCKDGRTASQPWRRLSLKSRSPKIRCCGVQQGWASVRLLQPFRAAKRCWVSAA